MAKLDPEQQKLAGSILGLGKQYNEFQKALQPEVLAVFGKGIQIAGHLMHDVQPIAQATGKALDAMLGAIDKEFQSRDVAEVLRLHGHQRRAGHQAAQRPTSSDLMDVLPGLLTILQPVAEALLQTSPTPR